MRRPAVYVRVRCPLCDRHIAGIPDAEGQAVQLVRHLSKQRAALRRDCAASEQVVTRRAGGWRLEERR